MEIQIQDLVQSIKRDGIEGARKEADAIIDAFLAASFEGGRHQQRIDKIPLCSGKIHGS